MRFRITILCILAVCLTARADVIQLKNGRRIVADSVREINGRVEFVIGDNTYSISKSLVERIDSGGPSPVPSTKQQAAPEDIPQPREQVEAGGDLTSRVIRGGQIDTAALKAIESEGSREKSAAAYNIAANFEEKQHNLPEAARYIELALLSMPDHPVLLEHYVSVLLQLGRNADALPFAERASHAAPQSADAFALLGYAYYRNNHNAEAITAFNRSLALRPDDRVRALLARLQRESTTEADFRQQESSHFVLRYEGAQAPDSLRRQILDTLEAHYNELQSDLGSAPKSSISVSLYTDSAFFDVTQAPSWSAALNDGKIRIPISGITQVTPDLSRVLKHELTHSFIAQITHGHVPQWLNEGIAQIEEQRSTGPVGARLSSLYVSGHQIPLNQLEGSFQTYSGGEASVAYAESLAAAEYIRSAYGMSDIARILQRLGNGESVETALRSTIHSGYAQLESEIGTYLKQKYGA